MEEAEWFSNFIKIAGRGHNLDVLRRGIATGLTNARDKYGSTGLFLSASGWLEGVELLLGADAKLEHRYYRTGETALNQAVLCGDESIAARLLKAGANPDAANYWGLTPRSRPSRLKHLFEDIPLGDIDFPEPRIQNAEHLEDHHWPNFEIPDREERERLQPGTAVNLYVYGPRNTGREDCFKVRITGREANDQDIQYTGRLEVPIEQTHWRGNPEAIIFGPEHITTVYYRKET